MIITCTTTDRCTCILATRFVIVKMCYPELYRSVNCSSLHGNVIYNVCLINANLYNIVIKDKHYRSLLRPLRSVQVCDMIIACSEIIWNFCRRNISNTCVFNLVHAQAHYFLIRTHSIFPYILLWLIIERGTAVFEILVWYGFLCASKLLGLWFLLVYLKVLVDLNGLMIYPFNLHIIYSRSQINIENALIVSV